MTQVELAERVHVTQGAISMIEDGSRQASLDVIKAIAQTLGVTIDELLRPTEKTA